VDVINTGLLFKVLMRRISNVNQYVLDDIANYTQAA